MAYVGTPIDTTNQFQSLQGKRFSGNASTTAFTLDIAPNSVFDIEVFVENVRQDPNSAYSLNGTTLTFSAAPPSGTNNIYVIHQAKAVGTITAPVGGSIDMNGVELILDEDGDTSITADTDDQIDFKTGGTDRVVINSSGNVGIKNTSPSHTLDVSDNTTTAKTLRVGQSSGTSNADATMIIGNGGSGDAMLRFDYEGSSTDRARLGVTGSGQILRFYTAGDNERMQIDNSGNVLIGTTSTSINSSNFGVMIQQAGTLSAASNQGAGNTVTEAFGNAGQFRVMGDGDAENTNNRYGALSDRTLKENETSASSQWNDIKALQIKNYNLIEYPDRKHIGVIAQDLESAGMSGLVKTDDKGLKSVAYSVLYMKAVKALQEAMTKIEDLEARVTTLEG